MIELDDMNDDDRVEEIQNALQGITGGRFVCFLLCWVSTQLCCFDRTVPRVFVGGKFIGGGDDTAKLEASGELKKLLEAAGAL